MKKSVDDKQLGSSSNPDPQPSTSSSSAKWDKTDDMDGEQMDKYADESDSSSSDEFDSEMETDKEGMGNAGKSALENGKKKFFGKKENLEGMEQRIDKNNGESEGIASAPSIGKSEKVKSAPNIVSELKLQESVPAQMDSNKTVSMETTEVLMKSTKTASSALSSHDQKDSTIKKLDEKSEGVKSAPSIGKFEGVKSAPNILSDGIVSDGTKHEGETSATVNVESADKLETSAEAVELGEKSTSQESSKADSPTDVKKRPIPIIIVKPPQSPGENESEPQYGMKSGDTYGTPR